MKGNFTCLVNPRCTREFEHDLLKADNTKNVMIIGAGPSRGTHLLCLLQKYSL